MGNNTRRASSEKPTTATHTNPHNNGSKLEGVCVCVCGVRGGADTGTITGMCVKLPEACDLYVSSSSFAVCGCLRGEAVQVSTPSHIINDALNSSSPPPTSHAYPLSLMCVCAFASGSGSVLRIRLPDMPPSTMATPPADASDKVSSRYQRQLRRHSRRVSSTPSRKGNKGMRHHPAFNRKTQQAPVTCGDHAHMRAQIVFLSHAPSHLPVHTRTRAHTVVSTHYPLHSNVNAGAASRSRSRSPLSKHKRPSTRRKTRVR